MEAIILYGEENQHDNVRYNVIKYMETVADIEEVVVGGRALHEIFSEMTGKKAKVIVSFGLTAFKFITEGGECSLNNIPSRVIHIISDIKEVSKLSEETVLSLAHAVIVPSSVYDDFVNSHPSIPNIYASSYFEDTCVETLQIVLKELWCI